MTIPARALARSARGLRRQRVRVPVRAHSSNVSSSRFIFRSASANRFRSPPEKSARPSRTAASRPTSSTPMPLRVLRLSVARSGVPTSCGDGSLRARVRSSICVVPLVPDARRLHPPEHVASAIGARQTDVLADGQRHRPAGAMNLARQLHAGRRRADDEHAAFGQLRGLR